MHIEQHAPADACDLLFLEVLGMLTSTEQDVMRKAINNSHWVWIGDVDGEVFGCWGLIPPTFLSDSAYIWFYHTPALAKHRCAFIRHSRRVTAELLTHYPLLIGHCAAGAIHSLRWLRWCGATFGEPEGALIPFEIKAATYG
jgi:hypothetical protein